MKTFLKEIEDLAGYGVGLLMSFLAPLFENLKENNPIDWFGVTESFLANFMPTIAGAVLFNLFRREKLKDRWRSFLIVILFNAYGLEFVLDTFHFDHTRGAYFFGALCSYWILATIFDILRNLPTDLGPLIREGLKTKVTNLFKSKDHVQEN